MIFQYTYLDETVVKNGKMFFLNTQYDPERLDEKSIMLYSSYSYKNPDTPGYDPIEAPLALWRDHGKAVQHPNPPKREEVKLIEFKLEVSGGDIEGICKLYPWKG